MLYLEVGVIHKDKKKKKRNHKDRREEARLSV